MLLGGGGRWSLLRPKTPDSLAAKGPMGEPAELEALAEQYLRRWGVVFRDLLQRESTAPPWRILAGIYRRLEARGEIRGGRFVDAFAGEQFALPEAVEALRAARRSDASDREARIEISAADPLNLSGIITPPPRITATLANRLLFSGGVPSLAEASSIAGAGVYRLPLRR